jgi:hypothetical protein
MLLGYLELRGKHKTWRLLAAESVNGRQKAPATRKRCEEVGRSQGKLNISKPLTVILNLTQRGEQVQQPFSRV